MEEDRGGTHGDRGEHRGRMLALSHGALWTVANGLCSMGENAVIKGRLAWQRCGYSAYVFHICGHINLSVYVPVAECGGVSACMKGTEDKHCCPPPPFSMLHPVCLVP